MIFGLFILLIITLVVLNLFLKTTEKSSSTIGGASEEYFKRADRDKAVQTCEALCDNIRDENTAIEYCGAIQSIDWDGDNLLQEKASFGKWDFCENKVPCFVLASNCGTGLYDGAYCKAILSDPANNRLDYYNKLIYDPGSVTVSSVSDGCGLDRFPSNWKCKYGFLIDELPGICPSQ